MARFFYLTGLTPYREAHELQRTLVERRGRGEIEDVVLLLQHEETITIGRSRGALESVLAPGGVPVVEVERGGDATWHGEGQLVAYPILKLSGPWADLHRYLRALEQSVIDLLADRGLSADRDPRNAGVWLPCADGERRKVCSVGIACRRWVSWHGIALNVDPDLTRFQKIRPCGFGADIMTRLSDHLSPCPPARDWVEPLVAQLCAHLEQGRSDVEEGSVTEVARALGAGWSM